MKIIFTAKGTDLDAPMDARFGRTDYFVIYNDETNLVESYDNREVENEAHGAGPRTAGKLAEYGADVLITGNGPGGNAKTALESTGIKIYAGAGSMSVKEAYDAYKNGSLKEF